MDQSRKIVKREVLPNYLREKALDSNQVDKYRQRGEASFDLRQDDELTRNLGIKVDVQKFVGDDKPRYVWAKIHDEGPELHFASQKANGNVPSNARELPQDTDIRRIGLFIYDRQPSQYSVKIRFD